MNILFFLTPKSCVEYIFEDYTVSQTIKKMEVCKYSEVPVISRDGRYVSTLTEGDLLWFIKDNTQLGINEISNTRISDIKRKRQTDAVSVEEDMEDLITKAMNQNFVPVVDDKQIFIGIVKRKDIIQYCYEHMKKH